MIKNSKIYSTLLICYSIFWVWIHASTLYKYHFPESIYVRMYPDWILILNILLGLLGIGIGTRLIIKVSKTHKLLILVLILFVIAAILKHLIDNIIITI